MDRGQLKKTFIIENIDCLDYKKKMLLLIKLNKEYGHIIHEHADGTRLNLDLIKWKHIRKIYAIVKKEYDRGRAPLFKHC